MNLEKYNLIFIETFGILESDLGVDLVYRGLPSWDSVGHMALITMLEEAFDIMMDTRDIIDFSSYEKGKEVLGRYGVELS